MRIKFARQAAELTSFGCALGLVSYSRQIQQITLKKVEKKLVSLGVWGKGKFLRWLN